MTCLSAAPQKGGIRGVDFNNTDYPSDCSKVYSNSGFPDVIHVVNGNWKHGSGGDAVFFGNNPPIYGDVNGDGRDEAVVHTSCGLAVSTEAHDEIFVFGMATFRPKLLAKLSALDLGAPSHDFAWTFTDVQVKNGQLVVGYLTGGPRAQPAWEVTARFKVIGGRLVRTGSDKKPFNPQN
jgi:hypothetical protein